MTQASAPEVFEGVRPYRREFDEYVAMVGAGVFGDSHVELVDGELIALAPSQTRRSRVLSQVHLALGMAYQGTRFELYIDAVATLGSRTGRAPDIAAVDRAIVA